VPSAEFFGCGSLEEAEKSVAKVLAKWEEMQHLDFVITKDTLLKVLAMEFRLLAGIPVFIMGETGTGETLGCPLAIAANICPAYIVN
jgi:hypothetical protein